MTGSGKVAVGLGVLCALLVGVIVGGGLHRNDESERFYQRANKVIDVVAASESHGAGNEESDLKDSGKAIALGVMAYSADNDDLLPLHHDLAAEIGPYMPKDLPNKAADFLWLTDSTKNLGDSRPAGSREMGKLSGLKGDVVVYMDGHVKWLPK